MQTSPPHPDSVPLFPTSSSCGPSESCLGARLVCPQRFTGRESGPCWLGWGQLGHNLFCKTNALGFKLRWPFAWLPLSCPTLLSSLTVSPGSSSSIKLLHKSLPLKTDSWGSSSPGPQNLRAGPCYSRPINMGTPTIPRSSILLPTLSIIF